MVYMIWQLSNEHLWNEGFEILAFPEVGVEAGVPAVHKQKKFTDQQKTPRWV